MSYIYNLLDTWASGGGPYTSIKMNATDNDSGSASLLMDLQVGAASKFKVSKGGAITATGFSNFGSSLTGAGQFIGGAYTSDGASTIGISLSWNTAGTLGVILSGTIGFVSSATDSRGVPDALITRRGAANLRLGAADAAGSAIAINSVATNQLTLASAHGLTSGAAVIITGTTAPAGTSLNTLYYARSISAAVIELYLTFDTATATSGTTGIVAVTTAGTSASIRLATPFQRLSPQDFTGTDIPGQPLLINGSRGTGTGPGGSIIFQVAPAGSSGTAQNALSTAWSISGAGNILAGADNSYDIGASGANRPRSVFITGSLLLTNTTAGNTTFSFGMSGVEGQIIASGGGVLLGSSGAASLRVSGGTTPTVQFGGTTSAFPALKRVSANLQVIAADGTSSAGMIVGNQALATTATDGFLYVPTCAGTPTGTPTTQTGTAPIVINTTNNKLYFYSDGAWRDAGP